MRRVLALMLAIIVLGIETKAGDEASQGPLVLERLGMMYVGGRQVPMRGSGGRFGGGATETQIVDQAPVHVLIPPTSMRKGRLPVVMLPGMGLTSYIYLATPDGRDGWAQVFARAGHRVYVVDDPGHAVSGFEVGARASFTLWSNETIWRRWGIGSEPGVPYEDTLYPAQHIDQLQASLTPLVRAGGRRRGGRFGSPAKTAALVELLEQTGAAVVIAHSASGPTAFEVARQRPDLVRAIVAIEITGAPSDPDDVRKCLAGKTFLAVFGDRLETRRMTRRCEACETTARFVCEAGGRGEVLRLPSLGMKGNCHLMMQDRNSHEIAALVLDRLPGRGP